MRTNMRTNKIAYISRIICLLILIIVGISCNVGQVSARTLSADSGSKQFKKAWSKVKTDTGVDHTYAIKMTYGYNTKAVNEDYTWSEASRYADKHTPCVKNGNGIWKQGKTKGQFQLSKIEIRHKGSKVYYKSVWYQ